MSNHVPARRGPRTVALATVAALAVVGSLGASVVAQSQVPSASSGAPVVAPYTGAEPGSGAGMKLGYVSLGDSIPFVKLVSTSIADQAKVAGAELVFCDSELDSAKALDCVKSFGVQGVQAYLNFQLNEAAAAEICAAGPQVPVVSIDIHQKPCEVAFMGAANTRAGNIIGEAVGQYMKDNFNCEYDALVLMTAFAAGEVIKLRSDGTIQGFANICGEPKNYTAVDVPSIAIDEARTKFTDYLTTQPTAKRIVVLSLNDDMALGALAAARNSNRGDQVWIGAHGGDSSGWKELRCNPNWIADVAYFPERYGTIGIPALIDLVNKKTVQKDLFVDHKALTRDNITQYYPDAPAC